MKRDSLEGSALTPMYNPNILPLTLKVLIYTVQVYDFSQLLIAVPLDRKT